MVNPHLKGNQSDYHLERLHSILRNIVVSKLSRNQKIDGVILQHATEVVSSSKNLPDSERKQLSMKFYSKNS